MPIAINITGRAMEDDLVLNIAYKIEQQLKEGEFDVQSHNRFRSSL